MIYKLLRSSALFAMVVALGMSVGAYAQSNTHYGSQTVIANIANNGLNAPQGIAVDSSGNLYITDTGNGRILKETLSGGSYTQSIVATITPSALDDVAVDSSGNLYVIDGFTGKVYKETLSGSSYVQSTITVTGLSLPGGIAVDSSNNVYITDYDNKRVLKETPSGSSYTQTVVTTSGLSFPVGVAVDSSGNVYIADSGNNRVLKETLTGSSYTQSVVVDDSSIQWLGSIEQLAVDSSGSVYIGGGSIVKATFSGGTYHIGNLGDSIAQPYGVAVDSSGNVYATSTSGGGGEVVELSYPATSFGALAVGSTSAVLTFPFTKGTDINTASAGAALSMDAAGEFVDTGTGTCDTNGVHTYVAGTGCTVNVTFTPKFAGIRNGVVEFVNSSNVVVAEEFITGTGTAPQVAFAPGTQTTIGTTLSAPKGVAVDGKGDVYIADGGSNNEFFVETPSGSTYTQALVGFNQSGLQNVSGVAVDGAGDLYFGYSQSGLGYTVAQEQPIIGLGYNGNLVANTGLASGLSSVTAVAVDGGGNVYIADTGNNRVIEELYFSGITYNQPVSWQIVVAGTGLSSPAGVAVDGSGNVYIADTGNNRVLRETPSAGGLFTQSVVVNTGLSGPTGLAVDDIGNLYISDTGNQRVLKETVSGSSYTQSVVLSSGLGSPQGLALDAGGNIYIADATNKVVVKLNLATAPSLTFASTAVGSTSSDSPQTVTLENQGTAALVFPIPGTGNNPSISANFSLNSTGGTACPLLSSSSSTTGTLAANATCTMPISFVPTAAGIISGSLVLTNNNLNVAASTEKISLGGTGVSVLTAQAITFTQPTTPVTYSAGLTIPLVATGGASGNPVVFTIDASSTATGSITGSTLTVTSTGNLVIAANQAGNSSYSAATQVQRTVAVTQAAQAITFTQPTTPVTYSSGLTIPLVATGGASGNPVVFTLDASSTGTGTITGSTLTVTGVGSFVIDANQAGNTNYSAATQVQRTVAVTQAAQTITFTAPTSPVTYGVSPIALVATGGASSNAVVFSVVSGPATVSGSTLTITGAGTVVVAANQAGNTNYAAATQVTQSIVVNVIGAAAAPTFSPVAGTYTAAQTVTISDATSGATIYYTTDGTTPTTSSTKYTTAIPVSATETLQAIATATGYSTSAVASAAYTLVNPAPAISGLSPAFTNAGGALFTLTVNGSGFIASSTVYWGTSALTTTYVSATQLTAQVPAADIATAGTISITVQTPAPGGGTSNAWQFEVDTASTGTTGPTITSTTATVTAGSTASYPVTVPSSVTSISVSCLNLPAGATCSYSSATNMVTITTSPTTPKGTYQIIVVFTETVTTTAFLLPILLLPLGLMRRKLAARGIWLTACLGLVLLATASLSIGCGGGSSPPPSTQQVTSSGSVSLTIQ